MQGMITKGVFVISLVKEKWIANKQINLMILMTMKKKQLLTSPKKSHKKKIRTRKVKSSKVVKMKRSQKRKSQKIKKKMTRTMMSPQLTYQTQKKSLMRSGMTHTTVKMRSPGQCTRLTDHLITSKLNLLKSWLSSKHTTSFSEILEVG